MNKSIESLSTDFFLFLESSTDAIVFFDIEGKIVFCNSEFEFFLKQEPNSVFQKKIIEVCKNEQIINNINIFFEQNITIEFNFYDNNFNFYSKIFFPTIEKNVVALTIQKKVKPKENHCKSIIEKSFDCIVEIDANGNEMFISPSVKLMTGYTPEELIGKNFIEILHPDDIEKMSNIWSEIIQNPNKIYKAKYRHKHKTQEWIYLEAIGQNLLNNPEVEAVLLNVRDISENIKFRNEIIENERKLHTLMSNLPGMAYRCKNDKNWTMEFVSDGSFELTGYTFFELENNNLLAFNDIILPEYQDKLWKKWQIILAENKVFRDEYQIITKDNQIKWVWEQGVGVYSENGEVIALEGIILDITENKKILQKLIERETLLKHQNEEYIALNEELRHTNHNLITAKEKVYESEKLKTSFLQNMSHEIRTPLNAICGFADMLNDNDLDDEKRKSLVNIIINSSNQLLSIMNDILIISTIETKQQNINIKEININSLLIELMSIYTPKTKSQNISLFIKQQLNDEYAIIKNDIIKLRQVLTNLLNNAVKFTKKGIIEFGYLLDVIDNKHYIKFYVKDTGIGIKPELHHKIFERFRQAETSISDNYGGTGLGLAISKAYVEILGGKIWLESELNTGSTFYFTLPYNPDNIDIKSVFQNNFEDINVSKPTILVAEDDEFNFLYIEQLLKKVDCFLIHAKNGKEAVDLCNNNFNISLIIMDLKMPIMNGYEATQIIKTKYPNIPIVAHTAYALSDDIDRASQYGFDDYIVKPVNNKDLYKVVDRYLYK